MNTQPECSSSSEGEKCITLEPNLGSGDTVTNEEGKQTVGEFADKEDSKRINSEFQDINECRRTEMGRDRRHSRKRDGNRLRGAPRFPLIDVDARYADSSYVRKLTPEDIKLEKLETIRKQYWKEYGHMVDENIIMLAQKYLKYKDGTNTFLKTQLLECALLGLTKGPANIDELIKRLDTALEMSDEKIKFRFEDVRPVFTEAVRRIVKADPSENWLRKYLIPYSNGSFKTSRYEFPPPMMKIAAQFPDKMRQAWYDRLPKGELPYTEETLISELPILREMVDFTDIPHHGGSKSYEVKDHDFKVRKHANESNRRCRLKEITDYWVNVDDMTKGELFIGLMLASDCIIGLPKKWTDIMVGFMDTHKKKGVFNPPHSGEISTFKKRFLDEKHPIHKLLLFEEKTSKSIEFGMIPDAAAITFHDIKIIWKGGKEGFKVLKEWCDKVPQLDKHVHPDKYNKTEETLEVKDYVDDVTIVDDVIDETDIEETDTPEPFDIRSVPVDSVSKLSEALSSIAKNGLNINFNIGLAMPKENVSLTDVLETIDTTNQGLQIAIERMGLVMESIQELIEGLKK